MGRTYLITGGANSGKSRWAISYFAHCDRVLYISSNNKIDVDTQKRIRYSNEQNGVKWNIGFIDGKPADSISDEHKFFIFDGIPDYTSTILKSVIGNRTDVSDDVFYELKSQIINDIQKMIDQSNSVDGNLIIVTMEPGFSVIPQSAVQRAFRDTLAAVNQRIANIADEVYLSVSGIQMQIK